MLWLCLLPLLVSCAATGGDPIASVSRSQPVAAQSSGTGSPLARAKSHTELGAAYYETRQFATALDEARVAIAADASYAPAHNLLALVYVELKENRAAGEAFEKALRLAPGDPEIGNNYGWFLCQIGEQRKGMQYLQMAAGNPLYGAPAVALANAAVCAQSLQDFDGASELLARALRYDPNNPRALFLLADLNYQRGRYGEAQLRIADFHRRIEPTAESAWLALRIARSLGNRADEARFGALLRQRFVDSSESQKLTRGQYE
ncbi:type IV pilus biogenesis/stability protein PilW [Denitratisoma sp. DHT3]|uniref:type IV pilus biogenesis/stability protein PilW n=1 Tax=Denitratisoma sp. DHT3 TaxID=1981880 RepID=UPI001198B98A|nr:type IV pilus biogenesis/stability protein PilW [Denitratisoma sp. DHT3]QDX81181.1 type IV pilus biogenesis/stability protein PilW [Denitratisoma sp. DHT3]